MNSQTLAQDGYNILLKIKTASWFPYKSGNLKFSATSGQLINNETFQIKFDSTVADYIEYLEEGTSPHDIPRAFGRPLPFGIGGRFNGKFHPGSMKHKGFISEKSTRLIVDYYIKKYDAIVEVI